MTDSVSQAAVVEDHGQGSHGQNGRRELHEIRVAIVLGRAEPRSRGPQDGDTGGRAPFWAMVNHHF